MPRRARAAAGGTAAGAARRGTAQAIRRTSTWRAFVPLRWGSWQGRSGRAVGRTHGRLVRAKATLAPRRHEGRGGVGARAPARGAHPCTLMCPISATQGGGPPPKADSITWERLYNSGRNAEAEAGGTARSRREAQAESGHWTPSGRQPIPEALPPAPAEHTRRVPREEQEEADRKRSQPRASMLPPERYPLVGQGWFLFPEKRKVNPAYADVRAK
jgi:hypothetical protein